MENNPNFKEDLELRYLGILASYDEKDEFENLFTKTKAYLGDAINSTNNVSLLNKFKDILNYNQGIKEEKGNINEMS